MPHLTLEIVDVPKVIETEAGETNKNDCDPDAAALFLFLALAMDIGNDFVLNCSMHVDWIATLLICFLRDGP